LSQERGGHRQGLSVLKEKIDLMDLNDESGTRLLDQLTGEAVTSMKATVKGEMVKIKDITFTSRDFVETWLVANKCAHGQFMYFTDAVSLLNMIGEAPYSAVKTVSWESKLKTLGNASRNEPKIVVHSFEVVWKVTGLGHHQM
jgi:hypothetical protein